MGATPKAPDLKVIRGYKDPKTVVWQDGREWLRGVDWTKRKLELWDRGGGRCEHVERILFNGLKQRCKREMQDPHHIQKRSVLRDDRLENLIGLCRAHHDALDPRKPKWTKKGTNHA